MSDWKQISSPVELLWAAASETHYLSSLFNGLSERQFSGQIKKKTINTIVSFTNMLQDQQNIFFG